MPEGQAVTRIDLKTSRVAYVTPRPGSYCDAAARDDAVWILGCSPVGIGFGGRPGAGAARVFKMDAANGRAASPILVESGGRWLAADANDVWVLSSNGSISRIQLPDDLLIPLGRAGTSPGGFAIGAGSLWISVDVA